MARRKLSTKAPVKGKQSALVVGVSKYPDPADHLPGVAADVREIAKVLSSKDGTFASSGVTVLADKQATQSNIESALRQTFTTAASSETVFVYLAGHGDVVGDDYFFIAFDSDGARLNETGVSLKEIKTLFDQTKSRRVFLWLDFCHSGGILARRLVASDATAIQRAIGVVSGEGKVIVAACTQSQLAYEDSSIGHGLFTHALLTGLKGEAKSARGEVTALSLYEYIDHEVGSTRQQPVFFGEMTGRIVLMHYDERAASPKSKAAKKKTTAKAKPSAKKASGTWVMLGEDFLLSEKIRQQSDGKIELAIMPQSGEDEAAISALRPTHFGGARDIPFAANNDANLVRVEEVASETADGRQVWSVTLRATERQSGFATEMSVQGVGPDEIARRRVGRILLNEPPPHSSSRSGRYDDAAFIDNFVSGSTTGFEIKECIVRSTYQQYGQTAAWKEYARLKSIYLMKMTGTIEHVLELSLGAVRNNRIKVDFRGRRPARYSNVAPEMIEISGYCSLE